MLYPVPPIEDFARVPEATQVVYHGINKSGSMAMALVMRDSFRAASREEQLCCHYFEGGTAADFAQRVDAWTGPGLMIGHGLYGAIAPRPDRVLVTQFRHPLPRVLSCYNWLKNKHERQAGAPAFPSLEEWVERTKGKSHSQIIQFGLGYGRLAIGRRKRMSNRDIFETCIDAIERECFCFGIAEHFEESIFLFAALCRLPAVLPWVRDQRNPGRPLSSEIPESSEQLIRQVYKYDFLLYDYALKEFRKRIARIDFGDRMEDYKRVCSEQYNDRIMA